LTKFDSETFGKGYANGEFWVVHCYAETVYEEIIDNEQLMRDTKFFIPSTGGTAYIDNMCILKGAKKRELAHKFIDFIHRPEIYAEFCDYFGFPSSVNIPARQYIEGPTWYNLEDIIDAELKYDLGETLELYTDAWFNSIRAGN
jgi:spermidine/putrescine transport system substrate-binding protein